MVKWVMLAGLCKGNAIHPGKLQRVPDLEIRQTPRGGWCEPILSSCSLHGFRAFLETIALSWLQAAGAGSCQASVPVVK